MKKITTLLTAVLLLAASVSFASDTTPVPERIAKALSGDFDQAANIEWKTTGDLYKASFVVDGQELGAFYSAEGELVATSRKLTVSALPMSLQRELKEIAPVYYEEELIELLTDGGTEYYVQFNTGREIKAYKSMGDSWTRY